MRFRYSLNITRELNGIVPVGAAKRLISRYLSKVLHNTQKRGIIHHLAEEAG